MHLRPRLRLRGQSASGWRQRLNHTALTAVEPALNHAGDYGRRVHDRLTRLSANRLRLLVALMLAVGLGAMCTVVGTAGPMVSHSESMSMGDMNVAPTGATLADASRPLVRVTEKTCADCSTAECAALTSVAGLGLLTLLLLLLRRRPVLVVLMRRVASRLQGSRRPPPLLLSPTRFQFCVLRV